MSRNSKNARKAKEAAVFTKMRKNGGKGPARTVKVNIKKRSWHQLKDTNGMLLSRRKPGSHSDTASQS